MVPQKKQTNDNANTAFALTPFFRIVRGLKTESCLKDSLVWDNVLFILKRGIGIFIEEFIDFFSSPIHHFLPLSF